MVLGQTRSAECLKLYVATAASTTYRPRVLGKVQKIFRYFTAPWRQNHWAVVSRKCLGELVHCGVLPDGAHVFRSRYAALDSSSGVTVWRLPEHHIPCSHHFPREMMVAASSLVHWFKLVFEWRDRVAEGVIFCWQLLKLIPRVWLWKIGGFRVLLLRKW